MVRPASNEVLPARVGALPGLRALLLLSWLAGGCALQPEAPARPSMPVTNQGRNFPHHGEAPGWPLETLATLNGDRIGVPASVGVVWLDAAALRAAWTAVRRVEAVTPGARPRYRLIDDPSGNAFALRVGDVDMIGVHIGMVQLLGADEAAWAAVIGHELAHLNLRHADLQRSRRGEADGLAALASVVLTAIGTPLTPILAELATEAADKGYSREDERAADAAGIDSMLRAGYEPEGAVRFFEKLAHTGQSSRFAFFGSHPDHAERVAAARALAGR